MLNLNPVQFVPESILKAMEIFTSFDFQLHQEAFPWLVISSTLGQKLDLICFVSLCHSLQQFTVELNNGKSVKFWSWSQCSPRRGVPEPILSLTRLLRFFFFGDKQGDTFFGFSDFPASRIFIYLLKGQIYKPRVSQNICL